MATVDTAALLIEWTVYMRKNYALRIRPNKIEIIANTTRI